MGYHKSRYTLPTYGVSNITYSYSGIRVGLKERYDHDKEICRYVFFIEDHTVPGIGNWLELPTNPIPKNFFNNLPIGRKIPNRKNFSRLLKKFLKYLIDTDGILEKYLSKVFPDALERDESEEVRKKNTDEVRESSSETSNDVHGGSGNSQEVDSSSKSASDESVGQHSDSGSDTSDPELDNGSRKSADVVKGSKSESSKKDDTPNLDDSENGLIESNQTMNHNDRVLKMWKKWFKSDKGTPMPLSDIPKKGEMGELAKSLKSFFKGRMDSSLGNISTPLVDNKKLVKEIVTKRYNLARATKSFDEKTKCVIIAADVSGSCSTSSGATTAVCKTLATSRELKDDVIYIEHSNGFIYNIIKNGVNHSVPGHLIHGMGSVTNSYAEAEKWKYIIGDAGVMGAVLFGDSDGIHQFKTLWLDHPESVVVCMHDYRASVDKPKLDKSWNGGFVETWDGSRVKITQNLIRISGVNDSNAAAYAMRLAKRNIKK